MCCVIVNFLRLRSVVCSVCVCVCGAVGVFCRCVLAFVTRYLYVYGGMDMFENFVTLSSFVC